MQIRPIFYVERGVLRVRGSFFAAVSKGLYGNRTTLLWVLAFGVFLLTVPARGEDAGAIKTSLSAYKITRDSKGVEQREAADSASPGEIIEYHVVYTNKGTSGVRNLLGNLPIPEGMTYLADTGEPKPSHASVDGLRFDPVPLKRTVKRSDGTEVLEDVPYAEYHALQWNLGDLAGGQEKHIQVRVRLNADTPLTETEKN